MDKNKTFATLLASLLGGSGAHRFYLHGMKDFWGWAHFSTIPLSALLIWLYPEQPMLFPAAFFVLSVVAGFVQALVIGLTPDEKWDAIYRPNNDHPTHSGWTLVLTLILTLMLGATAILSAIARALDLYLTGGGQG